MLILDSVNEVDTRPTCSVREDYFDFAVGIDFCWQNLDTCQPVDRLPTRRFMSRKYLDIAIWKPWV